MSSERNEGDTSLSGSNKQSIIQTLVKESGRSKGEQISASTIVLQIFSRLPVESLARVKWVCKALLSLTSGPIVANMLASRGPRILILTPSSGLKSLDCSSKTSFTDEDELIDLDFPPSHNDIGGENTRRYIRLVGACNGLVGVSLCDCPDKNDRNFFLWNPSTGFHKKLPDFLGGSNEETKYMLGFGYDSTINDYKVIIVRETLLFTDLYFYTNHRYSVLETKTDSWREINDDGYCENDHNYSYLYGDLPRGYFLNGVLHWRTSTTILALDLTSEKFSNVPMPKVQDHVNFTTLSVLDGCLCLVSNSSRDDRYVELWTMKEYGAQSSWQKLFRVTENYGEINFDIKLRPLCFTTTGDEEEALFFLDNYDELRRFKPKDRIIECLTITERPFYCDNWLATSIAYEQSLVSLRPINGFV